jgi:hypothetical protein
MRREPETELKDTIHARLQSRFELDQVTGCWIYVGAWADDGRGMIRVGGKKYSVAKVSAWLFEGIDLNDDCYVYHDPRRCRAPACWNPHHLRIADRATAFAHLRRHGLWGNSLIDRSTADYMRLQATTMPEREIAEYHDVNERLVGSVLSRRTWAS